MDLYRTLRLSLYLLAASGAYAVTVVEGQMLYLFAVVAAGAFVYFTIDAGQWLKPARSLLAGILGLVLLGHFVLPALHYLQVGDPRQAAAELAHYLVLVQILLFFTATRTPPVFAFCAASLFCVVISGIMDPGPSLITRLVFLMATASWSLYLFALWRSRSRFEAQFSPEKETQARGPGNTRVPGKAQLSERSTWEGLKLTGTIAIVSVILGFFLFFTTPRVGDKMLAFVRNLFTPLQPSGRLRPGTGPEGPVPAEGNSSLPQIWTGDPVSNIGWNEKGPDFQNLHPIRGDSTPALHLESDKDLKILADGGRVYIRGMAYSQFESSQWKPVRPESNTPLQSNANRDIDLPAKNVHLTAPNNAPVVKEEFALKTGSSSHVFFAAGTPVRISLPPDAGSRLQLDGEGGLELDQGKVLTDAPTSNYTLFAHPPVYADQLHGPPPVLPRKFDSDYYALKGAFLSAEHLRKIQELAQRFAGNVGPFQRALNLAAYLARSGKYKYTLDLDQLDLGEDKIYTFITGTPDQRRGHCGFFATAFVLLARADGLPARLATGYAADLESGGDSSHLKLTARQSDAHAWGEVYFEGLGWVIFDPTPASDEKEDPPPPDIQANGPQTPLTNPPRPIQPNGSNDEPPKPGAIQRAWSYVLDYNPEEQQRLYGHAGEKLRDFFGHIFEFLTGAAGLVGAILAWGLLIGSVVAVIFMIWRRNERKRASASAGLPPRARAAVGFYHQLLQTLAKRGFNRRNTQTPREFAEAVLRRGGATFSPVLELTDLFERVRYGGQEISSGELERVQQLFSTLDELSRAARPAVEAPKPA